MILMLKLLLQIFESSVKSRFLDTIPEIEDLQSQSHEVLEQLYQVLPREHTELLHRYNRLSAKQREYVALASFFIGLSDVM